MADYDKEVNNLLICLQVLEFQAGYRLAVNEDRLKSLAQHLRRPGDLGRMWSGWAQFHELEDWTGLLLKAHAIRRAKGAKCDVDCTRKKLTILFHSRESVKRRIEAMTNAFQPPVPRTPAVPKPVKETPSIMHPGDEAEGGDGGGGGGGGV